MPSQDEKRAADQGRRVSRRALLQGAATAGAVGLAATAIGAAASPAFAATSQPSTTNQSTTHTEPIVVHVRDASTGDIEVFSSTSETRLRDKDLAARIARALG